MPCCMFIEPSTNKVVRYRYIMRQQGPTRSPRRPGGSGKPAAIKLSPGPLDCCLVPSSPNCSKCVLLLSDANKSKMHELYMQYLSCHAEWNKSHVVIRVRSFGCKVSGMIENSRLLGDNEIR